VVIPAYNEAGLLAASLGDVVDGLHTRGIAYEVIVVENGSTDGTLALARELAAARQGVEVRSLPRPDYGEALRTGILAARGEQVVIFDADYYDLDFLDRALARLAAPPRPAVVVGSKRAPGTSDSRALPRRLITAVFAAVLRVGFGLRVSDTHGMKAMDREAVAPLVLRCRNGRDLFDTELVLRADRAGLDVVELPVTVVERRPSRTPIAGRALRTIVGLARLRMSLWRDGTGSGPATTG
jgi:glycosyltransferase involved in cell wall biosynthesis